MHSRWPFIQGLSILLSNKQNSFFSFQTNRLTTLSSSRVSIWSLIISRTKVKWMRYFRIIHFQDIVIQPNLHIILMAIFSITVKILQHHYLNKNCLHQLKYRLQFSLRMEISTSLIWVMTSCKKWCRIFDQNYVRPFLMLITPTYADCELSLFTNAPYWTYSRLKSSHPSPNIRVCVFA